MKGGAFLHFTKHLKYVIIDNERGGGNFMIVQNDNLW